MSNSARKINLITGIALILCSIILFSSTAYAATSYTITQDGSRVFKATGERAATCDNMNAMAEVKWSISKPVTYVYKADTEYTFTPGKRKGIPYNQFYRTYPDISELQKNMDAAQTTKTAYETNPATGEEIQIEKNGPVLGLDCSSATTYALRKATGNDAADNPYLIGGGLVYRTYQYLFDAMRNGSGYATTVKGIYYGYGDNLDKVGDYGKYYGYTYANDSETIAEHILAEDNYTYGTVYENVYAKMKPGDLLVRVKRDGAGHIMLVTNVSLVYNSDGTINPTKSKVYIIDQSTPDKSSFPNGERSSWRNANTVSVETGKANNYYTFKKIASTSKYLPITTWPEHTHYTLSYDLNGGNGNYSNQSKASNQPIVLSKNTPVWEGHTFLGWEPTVSKAKVLYQPGGVYFDESDETLKAKWELNSGRILYDPTLGSDGPKYQTQYYGKDLKITSNIPVLKGYKFLGWATAPDAETAEYQPGDYFTDDSRLEEGSGETVTLYALWKKTVAEADVELSEDEVYYTGETFIPDYTVEHLGNVLTEGIDYTVTLPSKPKAAGKYTIKITGIGEYTGTYKATYSILKYDQQIDAKTSYKKVFNAKSFNLNASAETSISYKSSNKSVAEVSSNGNVNIHDVGTATITVTAKSTSMFNSAKKEVKITVKPRSTDTTGFTSKRKSITVNWARHTSELTGYQIKISRHKSMHNARKIKIESRYASSYTVTHLKPGKRYYIQIRTYRRTNGKTYYSSWSKVHRMKTKPPKEE